MVKSIVGKVVLGLMFLMSSTILFSQDSKVKYPDISGIWKIGSCLVTLTQFDLYVISSCICDGHVWYETGKFIDNKTFQTKCMLYRPDGCTSLSDHTYTLLKNGNLLKEGIYNDTSCGAKKGTTDANTMSLIKKFRNK